MELRGPGAGANSGGKRTWRLLIGGIHKKIRAPESVTSPSKWIQDALLWVPIMAHIQLHWKSDFKPEFCR